MNRPWNETNIKLRGDEVYSLLCQLSFEGLRGFRLPLKRSLSSLFYAAMSPVPLDQIDRHFCICVSEPTDVQGLRKKNFRVADFGRGKHGVNNRTKGRPVF